MQFTSITPQTVICLNVTSVKQKIFSHVLSIFNDLTVSNYILYLYWTQCQKHTVSSSNANDSNNKLPSQCLKCMENDFFPSSFDTVSYFLESWINVSLKHNIHTYNYSYIVSVVESHYVTWSHLLITFCCIFCYTHTSPLTGLHPHCVLESLFIICSLATADFIWYIYWIQLLQEVLCKFWSKVSWCPFSSRTVYKYMTSFQAAGPILYRQRTLIRHATRQPLFTHCDKDGETRLGSINWYLHVVHNNEISSSCMVCCQCN
jgi:hypothetical protein